MKNELEFAYLSNIFKSNEYICMHNNDLNYKNDKSTNQKMNKRK